MCPENVSRPARPVQGYLILEQLKIGIDPGLKVHEAFFEADLFVCSGACALLLEICVSCPDESSDDFF